MKHIILILCGLVLLVNAELCHKDSTVYDLPEGILFLIVNMFTYGTVFSFTGCSDKYQVNPNRIGFWLYNSENHDTPIKLSRDNPKEIDPTQKTIFIIHGWTCNITGDGYPELKNAYLKRYPKANLIFIEWTTYAVDYYIHTFCRIPRIAEVVGAFICNLNRLYGLDINRLHIVGHSMGAQVAGLVGQETQRQCKRKLGRISGLDPAGPLYQLVPESRRLDASDATVVDVIHTNQGVVGYYGSCGTVDYYPNCGYSQPGCQELTITTNFTELYNMPYKIIMCSHLRSLFYFTESILSDNFKAASCTLCPGATLARVCVNDFFYGSASLMGEGYSPKQGTDSKYYLKTNSNPPYARGEL